MIKASGFDDIPVRFTKAEPNSIGRLVTRLVNSSIASGIFQDLWKLAVVTPIQKTIYYLFIYYQFLSKTGLTQKAKPVQGASPQKLHTTYKLHIHTINNYKNETYTNKNLSYSELKNKKCFNVN